MVELCKDMGHDYTKYAGSLKKLERAQETSNPIYDEVLKIKI